MRLDPDDAAFLWDMLETARGVVDAVRGVSFERYRADTNLRLAIERRIEIIGEAANRVSRPGKMPTRRSGGAALSLSATFSRMSTAISTTN
ncbi:MAG: HepT-like ribonuclease domain-containing protein [Planctomycetota bacterium]